MKKEKASSEEQCEGLTIFMTNGTILRNPSHIIHMPTSRSSLAAILKLKA